VPTRRTFIALSLVAVLFAAGVAAPALVWVGLALDAAILGALVLDLARARRVPVAARRRWPTLLTQGTAAEVEVELTCGSAAATVWLREGLHPGLAAAPLRHEVTLSAAVPARWRYPIVPRLRGEHEAAPLTARVLGPWGLAWAQRDLLPPERRRVYPQVRWEGRVARLLVLAHRRQLGQAQLRHHGIGSEPYALREYLPGDPLSRVHWKATARHGRLITREDTWERGGRLVILLDCARAMTSLDGQRSKLDHALATALALTRVAAARGDRVTVIPFADRVERIVRVRPSTGGLARAYRALYDVQARLVEPAYDAAAEAAYAAETRRAVVVLFTSVVDLAAAELLREAILRLELRHRPFLVNLEDPEIGHLASGAPATVEDAFAKVASMEITLANRRLARHLRRAGVRVVTTAADTLALDTLGGYLAMLRVRAA
jgi:uncharacterized protein (DUF58 family)